MVYRESNTFPRILIKRFWLRPLCWVIGHRWHIFRINKSKHIALCHLHSHAGIDQFCIRCGAEWNDFDESIDLTSCLESMNHDKILVKK